MTTLVFDQELVGRLQALHRGGFSIRAEQVITEHLAKVGQHRAGGRTPHEIKQYIWQQMQWGDAGAPAAPQGGDLHSLRQSVRANTEVIQPPGTIRPQAPGQQYQQPGQYPPGGQLPQSGQFPQPGQFQQPGTTPGTPPGGIGQSGIGQSGGDAPESGRGPSVVGEILAWVPRVLLALSVYQLVRLVPGFDVMPDVSRWDPFRTIGDGVLGTLNLNPDWSDQAANLTIPVLGVVLAALLNYIPPLRRGRKLHTWPYVVVIVAWIAVFVVSGVTSFTSGATDNLRQGVQEQIQDQVDKTVEDQKQRAREDVENAVGDQIDQMTDDARDAAKDAVEEQGQGNE
jgi:hypothetical protein